MSNDASKAASSLQMQDDDEPDDWDKRIYSTGCADENMKLTDCYYEKKDWRACKKEPGQNRKPRLELMSTLQMEIFRACWKKHGNDKRTAAKDV
ncbi:hypothetical protein N0V90_000688 [Kalmusia sp. IMI 367209]|nr:hypothetical protein N0V90_000688 [Kalmusia sp. IMI 367209]